MKKATALILVTILLMFIVATALAYCNHTWYDVETSKKLISKTTAPVNACNYYPYGRHDHITYKYRITQRYVCSKGCGATKTVTSTTSTIKCTKK